MSGQQQPDPLTGTPSVVPAVDAGQGGGGGGGGAATGGGGGSMSGGGAATGGGAAPTGGGVAASGGGAAEPTGGGAGEPIGGGSPPPPPICVEGEVGVCTTSCGSQGTRVCNEANWGPCRVPNESCDNGVDDDCDGRIDHSDTDCTPIVHTCEMNDGNGCNGDWGYGDRCAPSDNENGCSAERFNAWCNRRNPATPDIWENYVQGWVTNRCDGALEETGGQYNTFFCRSSGNDEFRCTTPLVFSFDSSPVKFEQSDRPFAFTPRVPVQSDWPSAATPWLARDLNDNGRIDDGSELFGSNTRVGDGIAKHGFEALAALDADGNGRIDAQDPAFRELVIWRDANGDRRSQRSELTSLGEERIDSIALTFTDQPKCDSRGNCERQRASFGFRDASGTKREGNVIDVWLKTSTLTPTLSVRR
ncbi:MAG: hypothetical protein QM817_08505 [Archangium sp.]